MNLWSSRCGHRPFKYHQRKSQLELKIYGTIVVKEIRNNDDRVIYDARENRSNQLTFPCIISRYMPSYSYQLDLLNSSRLSAENVENVKTPTIMNLKASSKL